MALYLSIYDLILYFSFYSFLGWCTEEFYSIVIKHSYTNRGFLHIPFCPIYGFSITALVILCNNMKLNLLSLFIFSVIITTAIEYLTGYLMENVYNNKWWDYSNEKFNIKGYVCIKFSLYWGLSILLIVKLLNPIISNYLLSFNNNIKSLLALIMVCIFLFDFIISSITSLHSQKLVYNNIFLKLHKK